MGHDLDTLIALEISAQVFEHGWRKIDGNEACIGMSSFNESKKPSGTTAKVEDLLCTFWNEFEQSRFAFGAVRDGVRPTKIVERVLCRRPQIYVCLSCHTIIMSDRARFF
jgi:hypothetical protein